MIRQVDFLIAYVTHPASNPSKSLVDAKCLEASDGIRVTNIDLGSIPQLK